MKHASLSRYLMKEGFIACILLVALALFVIWWGSVSVGYVANETLEVGLYEGEAASVFLTTVDEAARAALMLEMNKTE